MQLRSEARGAALFLLLVPLVLGGLGWLLGALEWGTPRSERAQRSEAALRTARAALIGYALHFRDRQMQDGQFDWMYGLLPLPDLGSSRNNNVGCSGEGCDAALFAGIAFDARGIPPTIVGRFPWKTLGTGPLKDGDGECLWLIVSALHGRIRQSPPPASPPAPFPLPIHGDTLGQLAIVSARGEAELTGLLADAHRRPVAIVYAPGPPLPGQDRSRSLTDEVDQCGGNYDARNYLDPATVGQLGTVTHWFAGSTNAASGKTGDSDPANDPDPAKGFSLGGSICTSGGTLRLGACDGPPGANDRGIALSSDDIFRPLHGSAHFIADLDLFADRIVDCLRAGSFTPQPMPAVTPPDKSVGRLPENPCYGSDQEPRGYAGHYRELFFVAKGSGLSVNGQPCDHGVLLYAGLRAAGQRRSSASERNDPKNYLEGANLAAFTGAGSAFFGPQRLKPVPLQSPERDIVRCLSAAPTFTTVASPRLTELGSPQLAAWVAARRTLVLGHENVTTAEIGSGNAAALFGCAWESETRTLAGGLRVYFNFRFKRLGTSVGNNGFLFALADGELNAAQACGAAGSHLGYSGVNGWTPPILPPKIGIEFDQGRDAGFNEIALYPGRNDPCGTSGCGGSAGYNSHAALVYWGHALPNAFDGVSLPANDDNAHGLPNPLSLPGHARPPPRNPPHPGPGIAFKDLRDKLLIDGERWSWLYHVRIEVTPLRLAGPSPTTRLITRVWLVGDASKTAQIAALRNPTRPMAQLMPNLAPTLSDTAIFHDVALGTCGSGCPAGSDCRDGLCVRPALRTLRLGFTNAQRTQDQEVHIGDFLAVSLP